MSSEPESESNINKFSVGTQKNPHTCLASSKSFAIKSWKHLRAMNRYLNGNCVYPEYVWTNRAMCNSNIATILMMGV